MSGRPEQSRMFGLAADVSDGRSIDWDTVERDIHDADTITLLKKLRRVEMVVQAHRQVATSDVAGAAEASLEPGAPLPARMWRHLVLRDCLGSGAFGTVFRAWDPQLDREVAVKLLSNTSRSPLDEARHLARIRHSNVVTVYGAEQDDAYVGIWMELIQGETLHGMIRERGPMSAREVAGIGIDLCRAVSALHAASLLHRDIKPQNVMREIGGRIVLMDFSSVRAVDRQHAKSEISGTPLYMAPEVIAGRPPTVATDIYSLGVLLFYLLSGRYPVNAATYGELKAAHARGVRTRLRDVRPEVPETVVQVVERALSVNPSARYQTAGELEHALAATVGAQPLPVATPDGEETAIPTVVGGARLAAFWLLLAAVLIVVAALAAVAWWQRAPVPEPQVVRLTIGPPYNVFSWPRISPDGRLVVFGTTVESTADGKVTQKDVLMVRPLDSLIGRSVLDASIRETAFWSADSQHIGYFADGKLKRVAADGNGQPQVLADAAHPRGGAWSRNGTILFAAATGIHRILADGTGLAQVTSVDPARGEFVHAWPDFLPDGRRFLYIVRSTDQTQSGIYLGSLDSPSRTRLMPAFSRTAYSSGHLVYVRDGTLMAQPFDEHSGNLSGNPEPIAAPAKYHEAGDGAFDVSDNGVLIYRPYEGLPSTRLEMFDRHGRVVTVVAPAGYYRHPRFSPDQRRVAVERVEPGNTNPDIWVFDIVRGSASRLTSHDGPDVRPTWSPDGREIVFSSDRGRGFNLYTKTVDGTEPERLTDESAGDQFVEDWSRDGRSVIVTIPRSGLWIRSLTGDRTAELVKRWSASDFWQSRFSPDGRWLAYVSSESGRPEVYVEPLPATGARWQLSTRGGTEPHWPADGRELVYLDSDGVVMSVPISYADGRIQAGTPAWLFHVTVPDLFGMPDTSLSNDGEHFVANLLVSEAPSPPIHVIVNWPRLLGQ